MKTTHSTQFYTQAAKEPEEEPAVVDDGAKPAEAEPLDDGAKPEADDGGKGPAKPADDDDGAGGAADAPVEVSPADDDADKAAKEVTQPEHADIKYTRFFHGHGPLDEETIYSGSSAPSIYFSHFQLIFLMS